MNNLCILFVVLTVCAGADFNTLIDSHYSIIKSQIKTEISSLSGMINSIKQSIDKSSHNNSKGVQALISNDIRTIYQQQLTMRQHQKNIWKKLLKNIHSVKSEDKNLIKSKEVQQLIGDEMIRQANRDSRNQQKIQDVEGQYQAQQRLKLYEDFYQKEVSFYLGGLNTCENNTCNQIKYLFEKRLKNVEDYYKELVESEMSGLKELIKTTKNIKEQYTIQLTKYHNALVLRKRLEQLTNLITRYQNDIIKITSIHSDLLRKITEEHENQKQIIYMNFLSLQHTIEKQKIKLQEAIYEQEELQKHLDIRNVFIPDRFKKVRRNKSLRKFIVKQKQTLKKLQRKYQRATYQHKLEQQTELNIAQRKIGSINDQIDNLENSIRIQTNGIKQLKEEAQWDTTLSSTNGIKALEKHIASDHKQIKELHEALTKIEKRKEWLSFSLTSFGREQRIEKLFNKLEQIEARIESSKARSFKAEDLIESTEPKTRRTIEEIKNYKEMKECARNDYKRLIQQRDLIVSRSKTMIKKHIDYLNQVKQHLQDKLQNVKLKVNNASKHILRTTNDKAEQLDILDKTTSYLEKQFLYLNQELMV
ncbi:Myosin-2 heavy chain [Entamoeba marina]